jgi:hypothetical protein
MVDRLSRRRFSLWVVREIPVAVNAPIGITQHVLSSRSAQTLRDLATAICDFMDEEAALLLRGPSSSARLGMTAFFHGFEERAPGNP